MSDTFSRRFSEIFAEGEAVAKTRKRGHTAYGETTDELASDRLLTWVVRAESLIATACGKDSEHIKHFREAEKGGMYVTEYERFDRMRAVFLAAKADFEGGYLSSFRSLVQSEVFNDELELATELLDKSYKAPAAVVSGVVLETTLRTMCADRGISPGKLDEMNADLAKAGAYNLLQQKRITALAQVRNDAAHGNWDQFTESDVKSMIDEVGRFLADNLR